MNVLSIMISSSTIIITVLILVLMAVIGYYADKTIYSKEYKEKQERKKAKKINIENARLSDLVGEKKELNNQDEQILSENEVQEEIAQAEANNDDLVSQESVTSFDNNNLSFDSSEPVESELEFDSSEPVESELEFDSSEPVESELEFDNQTNEENLEINTNQSQELMFNNSEEAVTSESLEFDNQVSEQKEETSVLEENATNLNTELSLDNPTSSDEQTNDVLQFDQQLDENNTTDEMIFNDSLNSSVTEEPTSESTQENEIPSVDENTYYNNRLTNISQESSSQDSGDIEQTSDTSLNLETRDLAFEVENNYQNVNEQSVSSTDLPSHHREEDFQMDEDLENKLKADILQSIKTIEEETMNTTDSNSFNTPVQSSNSTESTNLSLDDDLGINELPKLKTDIESRESDELAVDDIFKI